MRVSREPLTACASFEVRGNSQLESTLGICVGRLGSQGDVVRGHHRRTTTRGVPTHLPCSREAPDHAVEHRTTPWSPFDRRAGGRALPSISRESSFKREPLTVKWRATCGVAPLVSLGHQQPTGLRGDLDTVARRRAAAPARRCDRHRRPNTISPFFLRKIHQPLYKCIQAPYMSTKPPNRPQTPRSTMAPISRGRRLTLDDAPKKIAICRTASQSYGHAAIVSCRSRTPPTGGEAGLLISVDRPRWSRARECASSRIDRVCSIFIL